jgi:hypothetical protein
MNRFFGMIPSSEVKKEKRFRVDDSELVTIVQSGENGWTVIYPDYSSEYSDEVDTTENNFNKAMNVLASRFNDIIELDEIDESDEMEEI